MKLKDAFLVSTYQKKFADLRKTPQELGEEVMRIVKAPYYPDNIARLKEIMRPKRFGNMPDLELRDEFGNTPLIIAADRRYYAAFEVLMTGNPNVNAQNTQGETALMKALSHADVSQAGSLLERGAKIEDLRDNDGMTAFLTAVKKGWYLQVEMLLEKGINTRDRDKHGRNALVIAIINHDSTTARRLIDLGIDIHTPDKEGATPLIWAAACGEFGVAYTLMTLGVPLDNATNKGDTALSFARMYADKNLAIALEKALAGDPPPQARTRAEAPRRMPRMKALVP